MIEIITSRNDRLEQGDVIRDVRYVEKIDELPDGTHRISRIIFPLVVILTQDCDLNWDFKNRCRIIDNVEYKKHDKLLISALAAPIYVADQVIEGIHLKELGRNMEPVPKTGKKGKLTTRFNTLKNNDNPRYHYLEMPKESRMPDLIVDFKHYFSADVEYLEKLKKETFAFRIGALYREHTSQRFANYVSRIGLPDES